jgi:hypothetical protein
LAPDDLLLGGDEGHDGSEDDGELHLVQQIAE